MPKSFFESIKNEIKRSRQILVCSHVNPDPDAIGSTLALCRMLKKLKKRVTAFIPGFEAYRYEALAEIKSIHRRLPSASYDLVLALDYGKFHRLSIDSLFKDSALPRLITIDHHPKQDQRGNIIWIDTKKAAVAEMVYDLAKALKLPIDSKTALFLLFGIAGDTVGFSTPSTTPLLLEKVSDLMKRGGSLSKAQSIIKEWSSLGLVKLAGQALLRAKTNPRKRFAWSWVREREWKAKGVEPEELSFIANNLRLVRGIMTSLLLVEQNGKWYGHLRSRGESKADLGKIAERLFGGGGHIHAAGFAIKLPRARIVKKILDALPAEK
jgi:phosphoesterase RecJ-like protein